MPWLRRKTPARGPGGTASPDVKPEPHFRGGEVRLWAGSGPAATYAHSAAAVTSRPPTDPPLPTPQTFATPIRPMTPPVSVRRRRLFTRPTPETFPTPRS